MISSISQVSSTSISPPDSPNGCEQHLRVIWWIFVLGGENLLFLLSSWCVFFGLDFYLVGFLVFLSGDSFKIKNWFKFFWGALNCGNLFKIGSVSRKKGIHFQHTNSETGSPLLPLGNWIFFFVKNPISVVWIPRKQTLRRSWQENEPKQSRCVGKSSFRFHVQLWRCNEESKMVQLEMCCLEKRHLLENKYSNFNP